MEETSGVRRQLTLFVSGAAAPFLEALRQRVDSVQFGLIRAHVTLCREDELANSSASELRRRLSRTACTPLTLVFGPPVRFGAHGMLLPCIGGEAAFHQLRVAALDSTAIRAQAAHVTLAHPRNPRAPANVEASFSSLPARLALTFMEIALIEQRDAQPWVVCDTMAIDGRDDPARSSTRARG